VIPVMFEHISKLLASKHELRQNQKRL